MKKIINVNIKTIDLDNFSTPVKLEYFLNHFVFDAPYSNLTVVATSGEYDGWIDVYGDRLETDEENQKRLNIESKQREKKENQKKSQKQKDLSTIKTLMEKNKFSPDDLK